MINRTSQVEELDFYRKVEQTRSLLGFDIDDGVVKVDSPALQERLEA
ncbi:hypothetical protein [Pectobacterium polaris]|nr:hypothetical protein [Pectobacterium polaris]